MLHTQVLLRLCIPSCVLLSVFSTLDVFFHMKMGEAMGSGGLLGVVRVVPLRSATATHDLRMAIAHQAASEIPTS